MMRLGELKVEMQVLKGDLKDASLVDSVSTPLRTKEPRRRTKK